MTDTKQLKNRTPSEIQSFVSIVRLASDLMDKGAFHEPVEDIFDAIYQTVHLVYFASDIIADHGEETNENN